VLKAPKGKDDDAPTQLKFHGGIMIVIGMVMESSFEQEAVAGKIRKFLNDEGYTSQVDVAVIKEEDEIRTVRDRVVDERKEMVKRNGG
jgi:hypothetical protein